MKAPSFTKKQLKTAKWIIVNIGIFVIFLISEVYNINGLNNIAIFFYWTISLIGTLFIFFGDYLSKKIIEEDEDFEFGGVPKTLDNVFDGIVLFTLVYFGYNVLGVFYLLHMVGGNIIRQSIDKYKSQKNNSKNCARKIA